MTLYKLYIFKNKITIRAEERPEEIEKERERGRVGGREEVMELGANYIFYELFN